MITAEDLGKIAPGMSARKAEMFAPLLTAAMAEFEIDNGAREAAFLAQVMHESGQLHYLAEIASGQAYEGRAALGNTEPGDGVRFKGRGLIQITGRTNYAACGAALNLALLDEPELLEQPEPATRSAGWFWKTHGCNEIADTGDFVKLTRRINGGTTGLQDRQAYWARAQAVLGA